MRQTAARRIRLKHAQRQGAADITVFPIAMIVVLTVVLVLLMVLATQR